jgi:NAD+ synthase
MNNGSERPLAGQISLWIKQQVQAAGAKGIVLGISGGLDSAVVAALAKMAVGNNMLSILMPCHSSPDASYHAKLVADAFSIPTATVDLTTVYDQFLKVLPEEEGMAVANLRPRLRMSTLYYFAQARGYLVAGTGNKSEVMTGYFTKWGDSGVDMLPIADLYKTEVRELAKELSIPDEIITKAPTADLWAGQTDEHELGITYQELDQILVALETGVLNGHDPNKIEHVRKLVHVSQHKRNSIPKFIKG